MPPTPNERATEPSFRLSTDYVFTVLSSWLIPGAGHWLLGYRVRGSLLATLVIGLFWLGQALAIPIAGGESPRKPVAVSRKVSPIFFACQAGNGFSAILSDTLWGKPLYGQAGREIDRYLPRFLNLAILFTAVSGLLNYLIVLHVMDPRTWIQASKDTALARDKETKP